MTTQLKRLFLTGAAGHLGHRVAKLAEEWEQHGMHWCPINKVPQLAFDHNEMIEFARHRLDRRVKRRPVGFKMLPPEFTIGQLIRLYEIAIRKKIELTVMSKFIY